MTFTLAHLTDPHLTHLRSPPVARLAGKRLIGYLSWYLRRRRLYRPEALARIVADVHANDWDHCAITGDLTQIALPQEIDQAHRWLRELAAPERLTVIPGNHDCYGPGADLGSWRPWFDDGAEPTCEWPTVRIRGEVAILGVSTAVVTGPRFATGSIGPEQLNRLRRALLDNADRFRVVLIHHPPVPGHDRPRKRLVDADHLMATLDAAGVELLLHGHGHRNLIYRTPLAGRMVPVASLGSASSVAADLRYRAAWQRIHIDRQSAGGWHVEFERRAWDPVHGVFETECTSVSL